MTNTEINFLEKEPKRIKLPLMLLFVFLLLFVIVITVLFVQRSGLTSAIEAEKQELADTKGELTELQESTSNIQQLEKTRTALRDIKNQTVPRTALYEEVLSMLDKKKQLESFTMDDGDGLEIEVALPNLKAVSTYTGKLLEQPYVRDVNLPDVSQSGNEYDGTLALTIDNEALREELRTDAD